MRWITLSLEHAEAVAHETDELIESFTRCQQTEIQLAPRAERVTASEDVCLLASEELIELALAIDERIRQLEEFYLAHASDDRSLLFEKQRVKLRKCLKNFFRKFNSIGVFGESAGGVGPHAVVPGFSPSGDSARVRSGSPPRSHSVRSASPGSHQSPSAHFVVSNRPMSPSIRSTSMESGRSPSSTRRTLSPASRTKRIDPDTLQPQVVHSSSPLSAESRIVDRVRARRDSPKRSSSEQRQRNQSPQSKNASTSSSSHARSSRVRTSPRLAYSVNKVSSTEKITPSGKKTGRKVRPIYEWELKSDTRTNQEVGRAMSYQSIPSAAVADHSQTVELEFTLTPEEYSELMSRSESPSSSSRHGGFSFLRKGSGRLCHDRKDIPCEVDDSLYVLHRSPYVEPLGFHFGKKAEDRDRWVSTKDFAVTGFSHDVFTKDPSLPEFISVGDEYHTANPYFFQQSLRSSDSPSSNPPVSEKPFITAVSMTKPGQAFRSQKIGCISSISSARSQSSSSSCDGFHTSSYSESRRPRSASRPFSRTSRSR